MCTIAEHGSIAYAASENVNTFSPSFRLDMEHLLQHLVEQADHDEEVSRVHSARVVAGMQGEGRGNCPH